MERRAKGTGYLITNSDGTKTLRKTITNPNTGEQKRIQVTANSETACNKKMAAREKELEELFKRSGVASNMTVAELCYNYLNYRYSNGRIKRTTRDRDESTIRCQIENSKIGHLQIASVTSRDIDDLFTSLFSEKRLSASSIDKVKHALNPAFRWAVDRKELAENPFDSIKENVDKGLEAITETGADDEDVRILSAEEKIKVWELASARWSNGKYKYVGGVHFKFLVETGLRVGEWIALRWEDYDFDNKILTVNKRRHLVKANEGETEKEVKYIAEEDDTKNKKARNLVLSEKADSVLREIYELTSHKKPTDFICLTRTGNNYTDTEMEGIVNTLFINAGIKDHASGLHILRRTFATELFDDGYSIKEVAAYLGDDESTVARYYIAARKTKEVDGKRIAVVELKRK